MVMHTVIFVLNHCNMDGCNILHVLCMVMTPIVFLAFSGEMLYLNVRFTQSIASFLFMYTCMTSTLRLASSLMAKLSPSIIMRALCANEDVIDTLLALLSWHGCQLPLRSIMQHFLLVRFWSVIFLGHSSIIKCLYEYLHLHTFVCQAFWHQIKLFLSITSME